jgi:hypothetical protein
MTESEYNIFNIFKGEPREPFALNMHIHKDNIQTKDIFEQIKTLYCKGLLIQKGSKINPKVNNIKVNEVTSEHIEIMKRHMLSLGIDVKHRVYTKGTKNHIFKELLYDIQHIDELSIKVILNWKKDLIEKISIEFDKQKINKKCILEFERNVRKHYEANHFLKLLKPKNLREYAIVIKIHDNKYHVICFDFAKHIDDFRKKIITQLNGK